MIVRYQNAYADFRAFYEELWRDRRSSQRREYYHAVLWYLGILAIAAYLAFKHEEIMALFVFGVLAVIYVMQNWSFARHWRNQAEQFAATVPETTCTLTVDEAALTERFSGVELRVEWSQVHDYDLAQDLLLIRFLQHRAFVIPLRHLSSAERDELIATLEKHHIVRRQ